MMEKRKFRWKEKPMHGQYPRQMQEITTPEACYGWLKKVRLKVSTEALICAAQDQALATKAHATYILKTSQDPKCRMCKNKDETVSHLLTGCSKLAPTEYIRRHNEVARLVHRNICESYNIEVRRPRWKHEPEAVTENQEVKILWDFDIRTDRHITARRPDIVVIDKSKKTALVIDIAVPDDRNISTKEHEKITKYQELRVEIARLWNVRVEVVPVVIGALGAHTPKFVKYLDRIPGHHHVPELLKAALLGSAHILRFVLDLPESW